jgi:hypothetical protein
MHNDRHRGSTADVLSCAFAMYPPENDTSAPGSDNDSLLKRQEIRSSGMATARKYIRSQSGVPVLFPSSGCLCRAEHVHEKTSTVTSPSDT